MRSAGTLLLRSSMFACKKNPGKKKKKTKKRHQHKAQRLFTRSEALVIRWHRTQQCFFRSSPETQERGQRKQLKAGPL